MKYRVLGRYVSGIETTGFSVIDDEEKILSIKVSDFNELVKAGLVQDFKCIEIDGTEYVIPKGILISQLTVLSQSYYDIKDRIFDDNGTVIGYVVITDKDEERKISKGKAWELAFEGSIKNANATYLETADTLKKVIQLYD